MAITISREFAYSLLSARGLLLQAPAETKLMLAVRLARVMQGKSFRARYYSARQAIRAFCSDHPVWADIIRQLHESRSDYVEIDSPEIDNDWRVCYNSETDGEVIGHLTGFRGQKLLKFLSSHKIFRIGWTRGAFLDFGGR